jgi:hypothetical protein
MSENLFEIFEIKSEKKALNSSQESEQPTGTEAETTEISKKSRAISEEFQYPALRIISGIYKVLAIIIGIAASIAFIYGLTRLEGGYRARAEGTSIIISSLISGTIGVIALLAISELIKLFIDLESNSRVQINLLKKILNRE